MNKKNKMGDKKMENSVMPRESGAPGHGLNSGMNTGMAAHAQYGNTGAVQAGGTMMGMQQAPAAYNPPLQNA